MASLRDLRWMLELFRACALWILLVPGAARAQSFSALPALWRVPVAQDASTALRLSPSVGYGYTESVLSGTDRHQRLLGALAVGFTSDVGLGLEGRLHTRYDRHQHADDRDSSAVFEPRFALRYSHALSTKFAALAQLAAFIPASEAPLTSFRASTVDGLLALTFQASSRTSLSGFGGYRFDRSSRSIRAPETLSPSDWLALGVSDYDATLLGFGLQTALGSTTLFSELTCDLLLGQRAPRPSESPLRAGLGLSSPLGQPQTTGSIGLEILLSRRPDAGPSEPLVPFEPRITAVLGITHLFDFGPLRMTDDEGLVHRPALHVAPPELVGARRVGVLRGVVRDRVDGTTLNATVRVYVYGESGAMLEGQTHDGVFETELAPGPVELTTSAPGFAAQQQRVTLDEQEVTVVNVDLRRAARVEEPPAEDERRRRRRHRR